MEQRAVLRPYLNLRDHLWHTRGDLAKLGATLHRSADDAILVCRRSPQPALAAFEASAKRMELPLNRDKSRVTQLPAGFAVLGVPCGKRKSPSRGKNTIDLFPAQSAQQTSRNRLQCLTSRRAPLSPPAFVARGHPLVTGWGNYCRHTNASQAFRGLQRFVTRRFRRYVTQRSQGRGFGGQRFPNRTLYAMGLAHIGSGKLEDVAQPAHGGR